MPITENELRDLLRERSAALPPPPDRLAAVRSRAAARRRRELAVAAGALAVVVAAGALWALPRPGAAPVPPASPSPTASAPLGETVVTTGTVGGLSVVLAGPRAIEGNAPVTLELEATNPGTRPWTGTLGAGLVVEAEVPGMFEGGVITTAPDADPAGVSMMAVSLDSENEQFQGILGEEPVTLEPGATTRWSVQVQRDPAYPVTGSVLGWAAFVDREDDEQGTVSDSAGLQPVAVTPTTSTLSCASVAVGDWSRSEPRPWTLDLAYTAVVGPDGRATWTEIAGLGDQGTVVTSTQAGQVRSGTVMRALDELGAATASGFGAALPDRPDTLEPGRYVAYSGTRLVPVDFAGTCGPSGEPISGEWLAYDARTTGLLDCDATAPADRPLATEARAYCPAG